MRRSPLGSAFAAVLLLWFGLISAEPAILHSCPVHSGTSSPHAGSGHGSHGEDDSGPEAHSSHVSPETTAVHESRSHDDDAPEQHHCACIGDCSSGASIAGLPVDSTSVATNAEWVVRASIVRDAAPLVTAPEFLRPYANGPPSGHGIA